MADTKQSAQWVRFNPLTHTYDTPDGTKVAAELCENVACLADVLHIATIRAQQRASGEASQRGTGGEATQRGTGGVASRSGSGGRASGEASNGN